MLWKQYRKWNGTEGDKCAPCTCLAYRGQRKGNNEMVTKCIVIHKPDENRHPL